MLILYRGIVERALEMKQKEDTSKTEESRRPERHGNPQTAVVPTAAQQP